MALTANLLGWSVTLMVVMSGLRFATVQSNDVPALMEICDFIDVVLVFGIHPTSPVVY